MALPIALLVLYAFGSGVVLLVLLSVTLYLTTHPYPKVFRSKHEKWFMDPASNQSKEFPCLNDAASINLSVIVPAYNEEERLPPMLDECIAYLEGKCKGTDYKYEIIVVSDGSTDKTVDVAMKYSAKYTTEKVRVLALEVNRGKGGAVRLGMQSARGALLLFADADGATKFSDLSKLEAAMGDFIKCDYKRNMKTAANALAICIGSRAHLEKEALATRSVFRNFLMKGFHFLVWLFAVKAIKDTQCGFKLLTREAARICFSSMHVERWAFDVELLYIAQQLNIPIGEIAVAWKEVDGSKITPVWSWIQMGRDLGLIWLRYTIGAWKIASHKKD